MWEFVVETLGELLFYLLPEKVQWGCIGTFVAMIVVVPCRAHFR